MAGTIYLPVVLVLVSIVFPLQLDADGLAAMQYYEILVQIPMYVPAVLDPLIVVFLIHDYRRAALRQLKASSFLKK